MKAEVLAAARGRGGEKKANGLFARLPHYSQQARRLRALLYFRDLLPGLPRLTERTLGFAADRPWPRWNGRPFKPDPRAVQGEHGRVALIADTFNQSFDPANLRAASNVLIAAGYGVLAFDSVEETGDGPKRPLCCGRTFYDAGFFQEAREEALRFSRALTWFAENDISVVGLEPLCVLIARDEYARLGISVPPEILPLTFEEFAIRQHKKGTFDLSLQTVEADLVMQSHCHELPLHIGEKTRQALELVPGLTIKQTPPSCCGLNGLTGMTPETFEVSLAMGERALFPAIRAAGRDALIAATGFCCRKQIYDGIGRAARHPATILDLALRGKSEIMS